MESVSWQASHDLSCFLSVLYRSWFQRGRVLGGQAPAPHCGQEEGVQPPEQAHGQVVESGETYDGMGWRAVGTVKVQWSLPNQDIRIKRRIQGSSLLTI